MVKKENTDKCKMVLCEDTETGRLKIVYDGKCPKGMIEKMAGKLVVEGADFVEDTSKKTKE